MSLRRRRSGAPKVRALPIPSERGVSRLAACAAAGCWLGLAEPARAEVPTPPDAQGREFRVDFSARHLEVDADLGELSLSGDVVVTVGRYRLGGERVRLQRGPRGINVEGSGDIAFCSCEAPPVTLGYSSVTIAPPSDVVVENAVLRAGPVPVFWLPYLWLRSPDRLGLIFPSVEWRGDDGLLIGSGVHVPFESNQGRPAARALDLVGYGYVRGGARVDARLLTPRSTSLVRWDHVGGSALGVDAHGADSGRTGAVWAYDVDVSRGARGRAALSSLDAAARRYDHARLGAGSVGSSLFALGASAAGRRGDGLLEPAYLGPFGVVATGGSLGKASSYGLDLGASTWAHAGEERAYQGETRAVERGVLESSLRAGPFSARAAGFEQGELLSLSGQSVSSLRAGAGLAVSLPLVRRFGALAHSVEPQLLGRFERRLWDGEGSSLMVATAGTHTALGGGPRGAAARLWLGAGVAGEPREPTPVAETVLASDSRWLGLRAAATAEPSARAAEATARLRLGARGGTRLVGYVEARSSLAPSLAPSQAGGDVLPSFHEQGGYDREGLTTGSELTLALWSVLELGGGVDLDPLEEDLLGLRAFGRYRHACGCVAVAAFGSSRAGRGGFDAGLAFDLMP